MRKENKNNETNPPRRNHYQGPQPWLRTPKNATKRRNRQTKLGRPACDYKFRHRFSWFRCTRWQDKGRTTFDARAHKPLKNQGPSRERVAPPLPRWFFWCCRGFVLSCFGVSLMPQCSVSIVLFYVYQGWFSQFIAGRHIFPTPMSFSPPYS